MTASSPKSLWTRVILATRRQSPQRSQSLTGPRFKGEAAEVLTAINTTRRNHVRTGGTRGLKTPTNKGNCVIITPAAAEEPLANPIDATTTTRKWSRIEEQSRKEGANFKRRLILRIASPLRLVAVEARLEAQPSRDLLLITTTESKEEVEVLSAVVTLTLAKIDKITISLNSNSGLSEAPTTRPEEAYAVETILI